MEREILCKARSVVGCRSRGACSARKPALYVADVFALWLSGYVQTQDDV